MEYDRSEIIYKTFKKDKVDKTLKPIKMECITVYPAKIEDNVVIQRITGLSKMEIGECKSIDKYLEYEDNPLRKPRKTKENLEKAIKKDKFFKKWNSKKTIRIGDVIEGRKIYKVEEDYVYGLMEKYGKLEYVKWSKNEYGQVFSGKYSSKRL